MLWVYSTNIISKLLNLSGILLNFFQILSKTVIFM